MVKVIHLEKHVITSDSCTHCCLSVVVDKLDAFFDKVDVRSLPKSYGNIKKQAMNIVNAAKMCDSCRKRMVYSIDTFLKSRMPNGRVV
jgi:hypothetical protein